MTPVKNYASKSSLAPVGEPRNDLDTVVDLLAEVARANHRLTELQQSADLQLFTYAKSVQKEHTDLTELVANAEAEIEQIVRRHPEWFESRKSIPSPYGTVKLTSSTRLEVADEESAVQRVCDFFRKECTNYLRVVPILNLEALAQLDDRQLKALRIKRIIEDKFSIQLAKVNLGKHVKAAGKEVRR